MTSIRHSLLARGLSLAALALAYAACSSASPVLVVRSERGSVDNPTTQAVTNLSSFQVAAGNTVTVVTALPTDLSGYSQVWDMAFRDLLSAGTQSAYLGYLQQGGRLMLIGDNVDLFDAHNQGIRDIIAAAGGGTVGSQIPGRSVQQTLRAHFVTAALPLQQAFSLGAPAFFDNPGTGSWMLAQADDDLGSGLAFDVGDLVNARAGTLLSVLDVDFLGDLGSTVQEHGMANRLVDYMTNGPATQVPESPALALVGLALAAASLRARSRAGAPITV